MGKELNLSVEVEVKVKDGIFPPERIEGLSVFALPAVGVRTPIGKSLVKGGKAALKLLVVGQKPPVLDIVVSPLSRLTKNPKVRTQKARVSDWKASGGGFAASAILTLDQVFLTGIQWLDDVFTVSGQLVSRYVPEGTDVSIEKPIPNAEVDLYEVDRYRQGGPCIPPCVPVCGPLCSPRCEPFRCLPRSGNCLILCNPVCQPKFAQYCAPNLAEKLCGPTVEVIEHDWGESIRDFAGAKVLKSGSAPGCCGLSFADTGMYQRGGTGSMATQKAPKSAALKSGSGGWWTVKYRKSHLPDAARGRCLTDENGGFVFTFKRSDFFEATSDTTKTEDLDWDEWPDLLFEAKAYVDGVLRTIYSEAWADTRWNEGETLPYTNPKGYDIGGILLVVDGECDWIDDGGIDPSQTADFLFHGVGEYIEPGWIDASGAVTGPGTPDYWKNAVFGLRLGLLGQFSFAHIGKFYQVEICRDGDAEGYKPVMGETWTYSRLSSFDPNGLPVWNTLIKAPVAKGNFPACYPVPDYLDAVHPTTRNELLIRWTSSLLDGNLPRYQDGLYRLRVQILDDAGNQLQGYNPDASSFRLCVDNGQPFVQITEMRTGTLAAGGFAFDPDPVNPCDIIQSGPNRYLLIKFSAYDPEGHFKSYAFSWLAGASSGAMAPNALTGTTLPGGIVVLSPSADQVGGSTEVRDGWVAFDIGADPATGGNFQPCAYAFGIIAKDRSINGDDYIHRVSHAVTLTIM